MNFKFSFAESEKDKDGNIEVQLSEVMERIKNGENVSLEDINKSVVTEDQIESFKQNENGYKFKNDREIEEYFKEEAKFYANRKEDEKIEGYLKKDTEKRIDIELE